MMDTVLMKTDFRYGERYRGERMKKKKRKQGNGREADVGLHLNETEKNGRIQTVTTAMRVFGEKRDEDYYGRLSVCLDASL